MLFHFHKPIPKRNNWMARRRAKIISTPSQICVKYWGIIISIREIQVWSVTLTTGSSTTLVWQLTCQDLPGIVSLCTSQRTGQAQYLTGSVNKNGFGALERNKRVENTVKPHRWYTKEVVSTLISHITHRLFFMYFGPLCAPKAKKSLCRSLKKACGLYTPSENSF